jgi:hypothetical protein
MRALGRKSFASFAAISLPIQRVLSAMQIDDQAVREDAARMALGPSCVSPAPQLKRDWSSSPEFGWIPANLCDLSKGYFATTFPSSNPSCPATQSGLLPPMRYQRPEAERSELKRAFCSSLSEL